MMTFIRLLSVEKGFVTYEYGRNSDEMIGTVTVEINNTDNVGFAFYKNSPLQRFNTSTAHALTLIYRFIKENNYPKEYTYAC